MFNDYWLVINDYWLVINDNWLMINGTKCEYCKKREPEK